MKVFFVNMTRATAGIAVTFGILCAGTGLLVAIALDGAATAVERYLGSGVNGGAAGNEDASYLVVAISIGVLARIGWQIRPGIPKIAFKSGET
jgi:hypothetical protein